METKACIGARGEDAAVEYLTGLGLEIMERNWRCGRYEIDIIARSAGFLHIVEVKCRKKHGLTRPEEAITKRKFEALCKAASAYIEENGLDVDVRFDVVAVEYEDTGYEVRYIENAVTCTW